MITVEITGLYHLWMYKNPSMGGIVFLRGFHYSEKKINILFYRGICKW